MAPNIAIKQNPRLVNGNYTIPKEQDFILNEIEKFGFNYVLKKYLKYDYKKELIRKIKNKFFKAVKKVIR
ncbi:MAG: hypothetical protein H0Z22_05800 [Thermosipho sp. (in: Bacteria)]|nr:hypothetical protein [Thermosipho sp. (in: thermotogales)]